MQNVAPFLIVSLFYCNWSDYVWALVADEGAGQDLKVETGGSVPPFNVLLEFSRVGKVAQ